MYQCIRKMVHILWSVLHVYDDNARITICIHPDNIYIDSIPDPNYHYISMLLAWDSQNLQNILISPQSWWSEWDLKDVSPCALNVARTAPGRVDLGTINMTCFAVVDGFCWTRASCQSGRYIGTISPVCFMFTARLCLLLGPTRVTAPLCTSIYLSTWSHTEQSRTISWHLQLLS